MSGRAIELVTARIVAKSSSGEFSPFIHSGEVLSEPISERPVLYDDGSLVPAKVYRRWELCEGQVVVGPAVIEQLDTTTYVGSGWKANQERDGVLWMRREKT